MISTAPICELCAVGAARHGRQMWLSRRFAAQHQRWACAGQRAQRDDL